MEQDNFISHIREKSNFECTQNRSEKRASDHNLRRANFTQCAKKLEVPSPEQFVKLCNHFKRERKAKDLERICTGLANGPQYRKLFLQTEGILYTLIGCISGSNASLQMTAIFCIINLGLGSEEECLKLCKKAGPYLITCLSGQNPYIQAHCLWAVGNLCGSCPKVCRLLRDQGFEPIAIRALRSNSHQVFKRGSYAMNLYLKTSPDRIVAVCQPDFLKCIIQNLKSSSDAIGEGCWCLFTISTQSEVCSTLVKFGIASFVLRLLCDATREDNFDASVATALIRLLTNCIAVVNSVSIEICYKADEFVMVVERLVNAPNEHLREETLQLVANVTGAANNISMTGESVLEDSSIKHKLDGCLKRALASKFVLKAPNYSFASQYS